MSYIEVLEELDLTEVFDEDFYSQLRTSITDKTGVEPTASPLPEAAA